ncbi:hypothetical protein BJX99DRAFT_255042 [Aspergillus californicus]
MTTCQRTRNQSFVPCQPDFDNLDLQCTWSGNYDEQANIRVSLEVECVPNTQLQLFNVRDPNVTLESATAERLLQNELGSDNSDGSGTPHSPLFGFSPLVNGGHNTSSRTRLASTYFGDGASEAEPFSGEEELVTDSEDIQDDPEISDADPTLGASVSTVFSAIPCLGSQDSESSAWSRKRSATDADFTDSEPEVDFESGVLREILNPNTGQTSAARSRSTRKRATEDLVTNLAISRTIASPTSPRKSRLMSGLNLGVSDENCPTRPTESLGAEAKTPERLTLPKPSIPFENHSSTPSLVSQPTSPRRPEILTSIEAVVEPVASLQHTERSVSSNNAETIDNETDISNTGARIRCHVPRTTPSVPLIGLKTIFERTSESEAGTDDVVSQSVLEEPSGHHENVDVEEPASDEPEVKIVDGLVILENSEKGQQATFKIIITVQVYLPLPNDNGWSDLMIPGLPRTGNGKSGYILFLMPPRRGLEIRTTNVKRAKLVENCLIAEFVSARNLVIPLRVCAKRFCGDIYDFTVDQEVISHNAVRPPVLSSGRTRPKFETKYHAMCSIRLHNRCFWADRCCIYLYVDGGPEGAFRCDISTRKGGLKHIHIVADEYSQIGVSCIQITCSPKDLERLCLTWALSGSGQQAAYWVPRIYSTPAESRQRTTVDLRGALYEVLGRFKSFYSEDQVLGSSCDAASEPTQNNDSNDLKSDTQDNSIDTPAMWEKPTLLKLEQEIRLQIARFAQNPNFPIKKALLTVLFLVFLGVGFINYMFWRQSAQAPARARLEISAQTDQPPSSYYIESASMNNREDTEDHDKVTENLDTSQTLSRDRITDEDGDGPEASLKTKGGSSNRDVDVSANVTVDASAKSFRDTIDYWLGWTGP